MRGYLVRPSYLRKEPPRHKFVVLLDLGLFCEARIRDCYGDDFGPFRVGECWLEALAQ